MPRKKHTAVALLVPYETRLAGELTSDNHECAKGSRPTFSLGLFIGFEDRCFGEIHRGGRGSLPVQVLPYLYSLGKCAEADVSLTRDICLVGRIAELWQGYDDEEDAA